MNKPAQPNSSYYCEAFIDELCRKFDIPEDENRSGLVFFLNNAALAYKNNNSPLKRIQSNKNLRNQVNKFAQRSQKLREDFADSASEATRLLWDELRDEKDATATSNSKTDEFFAAYAAQRSNQHDALFGDREIEKDLTRLEQAAARVDTRLAANKGGRPPNDMVRDWISHARDFWEHTLNRKFKHDTDSGKMLTDAGDFCLRALKELDPDVTPSMVDTAMRQFVKQR